jgi:hypothetical protein
MAELTPWFHHYWNAHLIVRRISAGMPVIFPAKGKSRLLVHACQSIEGIASQVASNVNSQATLDPSASKRVKAAGMWCALGGCALSPSKSRIDLSR